MCIFPQLRYTGMLETVRIRRAGYNVRLTYEEFVQLYRILLPKGLLSSQKNVREFMGRMDLNKQHYQLGVTKIYMRESQKTRLDYKLHTKIIESIIKIQRWFKSRLQRDKFVAWRGSAVRIQSWWRMHLAQTRLYRLKVRWSAAIVIQSAFRMFRERRMYRKLLRGVVVVQAHIRGKLARIRHKKNQRQKAMKERYKLRPTQSLPIDDRSPSDGTPVDVDFTRSYPKLMQYSMDLTTDAAATDQRTSIKSNLVRPALAAASALTMATESVFKTEQKLRTMTISSRGSEEAKETKETAAAKKTEPRKMGEEMVDSRSPRAYNIDYATKQYFDDSFTSKRYVNRSPFIAVH